MKRKLLSIVLALCLTLTLLPTMSVAAGSYADTNGHWAEAAIERWSGYGILQGSEGKFAPDGTLTRAQMATILSRLLNCRRRSLSASPTFPPVSGTPTPSTAARRRGSCRGRTARRTRTRRSPASRRWSCSAALSASRR